MLSDREFIRYSRQIMLPEIGEEGQSILSLAHVLLIGAGGLGSAAALYLAASGIGKLVIADDDKVALSNLQRQLAFREADLGVSKAVAIKSVIAAINPPIKVKALTKRLEGDSLEQQIKLADLVLDCSDNMPTRYEINRLCYQWNKVLISGAASQWQGQLMQFDFSSSTQKACYQCLFPQSAEANHNPQPSNCSAMGIAGPVVGTIGNLQALEAIKTLLKFRMPQARVQLFDGLSLHWQSLNIHRDPACPVCANLSTNSGKRANIKEAYHAIDTE